MSQDQDNIGFGEDSIFNSESHNNSSASSKKRDVAKEKQYKKIKNLNPENKITNKKQQDNLDLTNVKQTLTPTSFGMFESDNQKYQRLDTFFRQDIQHFYKSKLSPTEQNFLTQITQQKQFHSASLLDNFVKLWDTKVYREELSNYLDCAQLIDGSQKEPEKQIFVIKKEKKSYLFVIQGQNSKMLELNECQIQVLSRRIIQLPQIRQKINSYFANKKIPAQLSQNGSEVIFLYKQLNENNDLLKRKIKQLMKRIQDKMQQPEQINYEEQYTLALIIKNMKKGLQDFQLDQLSYFIDADNFEEGNTTNMKNKVNRKDYQQYIRKKKKKIGRRSKGVLKTVCGGCMSSQNELYNPINFCSDCQTRFHKFCYTTNYEGLCDLCAYKKINIGAKIRPQQCIICPQRGLLYKPINQTMNIHIFCLLFNNLWKLDKNELKFVEQSKKIEQSRLIDQTKCRICDCQCNPNILYKCCKKQCKNYAHLSCAYLHGWNMVYHQNEAKINCCIQRGIIMNNKHRRKYILNYKKYVYDQAGI